MEKKIKIELPLLPNFLRPAGTDKAMAISEFTEAELREIGAEWTEALVKHAQKKIA